MLEENPTVFSLALLGNSPTQLIKKALQKKSQEVPFELEIVDFDIDQIEQQIIHKGSDLYQLQPDFILVLQSTQQLLRSFYSTPLVERGFFHETILNQIKKLFNTISERITAKVLWNNFYEIDDRVYGNFGNKTSSSFIHQLRKINIGLSEFASTHPLFIYDLCSCQNKVGINEFTDSRMHILANMDISLLGVNLLAQEVLSQIKAIRGMINKCIVLDLDNTLWGGVIGDDGLENIQLGSLGIGKAFTNFQYWLKELKNRGIILAVCSKNNPENAKEPFLKHPEMVLELDDIAVFVANWSNKVDNIKHIQDVLNIGFDSMVFIDDNPFERNMVRENIKGIHVPELPEDPVEYVGFLQSENLFETASVSVTDSNRTQQYQAEAKRREIQHTFNNEGEYLKSLNMQCTVEGASAFNIPRIAQLTQRSNQFNLRTKRYSEQEIQAFKASVSHEIFAFSLSDKFGNYGLVSVVVLEKQNDNYFIDTWIMSCRVLKRGLEHFVLNRIAKFARSNGAKNLVGEYLKTPKNMLVADHYSNLGFKKTGNIWILPVHPNFELLQNHISPIKPKE